MNHVGDRQLLVQTMADAVVGLARMAENGEPIATITSEVQRLRAEYLSVPISAASGSEPAELINILRRILRKKARTYWELADDQEHQGNRDVALRYYRVSVLLDGASDALNGPLPTSIPSRTNMDQAAGVPVAARTRRTATHMPGAALYRS
jgi:hypothetical protein